MSLRVNTAWVLAAALCGCAAPKQYGGSIPIDQDGLAARLHLLCRVGASSAAPGEVCRTPVPVADSPPPRGVPK